jgi:Domain of unknown function (DUF4395)
MHARQRRLSRWSDTIERYDDLRTVTTTGKHSCVTVRELFSFPNPVNDVSARLVAGGVVAVAVTAIASRQPWLLAVLAYGFVARVATGPTLSPLGLLVTRIVTPRLGFKPRYSPGPAKRFAQGVGAAFSVTAAVLALGLGEETAAYTLTGVLAGFAVLESAAGICVGCRVFQVLMRLGVIPESVCEECADVWARA